VGDYGKLDRQTGEFNRTGNIYHDMHIYEDTKITELVKDHPPKTAAREEIYIAASAKVTRSDLELGAEMWGHLWNLSQDWTYFTFSEIPGLAEASGSKANGPLVLSAEHYYSCLIRAALIYQLTRSLNIYPTFKLSVACSSSPRCSCVRCIAYIYRVEASVLACWKPDSNIHHAWWPIWYVDNEVIHLALVGSLPVPHVPGVTVGGEIEGKWWVRNTAGLFQSARDRHGKDNFTPLYMLKRIQRKTSWIYRCGENLSREHEGDDL